jgi:O-acetyl-ADP-ribose deacetylase (regulator of RNase III)
MSTHLFHGVAVTLDANANTGLAVLEVDHHQTVIAGRQSVLADADGSAAALASATRPGAAILLGTTDAPAGIVSLTVPFIDGQHGEYVTLERAVAAILELADQVHAQDLLLPALGCSSGWATDRAAYVVFNTVFRHIAETGTRMRSISVVAEGTHWELAFERVTRTMLGTPGANAAHG